MSCAVLTEMGLHVDKVSTPPIYIVISVMFFWPSSERHLHSRTGLHVMLSNFTFCYQNRYALSTRHRDSIKASTSAQQHSRVWVITSAQDLDIGAGVTSM
jgi:hypothetical protein